jgi:hypothetical protein
VVSAAPGSFQAEGIIMSENLPAAVPAPTLSLFVDPEWVAAFCYGIKVLLPIARDLDRFKGMPHYLAETLRTRW